MFKKTARGSLILLLGQVVSTLFLALGIIIVAIFLGSSKFGSLSVALAPISIALILQRFGIDSALTKYLAQYRHERKTGYIRVLIETGIAITLFISIALTLIVYLSAGFLANRVYNDPTIETPIRFLSFSIISQAIISLSYGITVGYERMALRSYVQILYSFLKSLISPFLVLLGYGIMGAVYGDVGPYLLSALLGIGFIAILYRSERHVENSITHHEAARMLFGYGFPLYLANILGGVLSPMFTSLLVIYTDTIITGNWSATLRFSVLLSFVTLPVSTVILPLFSKLEGKPTELKTFYRLSVKYSALFAFPISVAIMALSEPIIKVVFRGGYEAAPLFLRLYMLIYFFVGLGSTSNTQLLNSQKRTDLTFNVSLVSFIFAASTGWVLIPRYGAIGLIAALFVNSLTGNLYAIYTIRKVYHFLPDLMSSLKLSIAAVVTYFIVHYFTIFLGLSALPQLIIGGSLTLFVYILLVLLFRTISKKDIEYLKMITHDLGPFTTIFNKIIDFLGKYV